jgi:hypothetical protein
MPANPLLHTQRLYHVTDLAKCTNSFPVRGWESEVQMLTYRIHANNRAQVFVRDAQYVDFVRCLYAAVKGTCNVLVKVSLEVTY